MCDDCRAGEDPRVVALIDAFNSEWPTADAGPGHIVLADWNTEPGHVRWCIGVAMGALAQRERTMQVSVDNEDTLRGYLDVVGLNAPLSECYVHMDEAMLQATLEFLRDDLLPVVVVQSEVER